MGADSEPDADWDSQIEEQELTDEDEDADSEEEEDAGDSCGGAAEERRRSNAEAGTSAGSQHGRCATRQDAADLRLLREAADGEVLERWTQGFWLLASFDP